MAEVVELVLDGVGSSPPERLSQSLLSPEIFMQHTDDGQHPELWVHADLIIVGLSGMGKTPISQHLAARQLRVANYPLVRRCSNVEILDAVDPRKVVALMISPDVLMAIRRERRQHWGLGCSGSMQFLDYEEIEDEVKWAKRLYRQHPQWKVIHTTDRSPADVAEDIMRKVVSRINSS